MTKYKNSYCLWVLTIFNAFCIVTNSWGQKLHYSPDFSFIMSKSEFSVLGMYKDKVAVFILNSEGAGIRLMDDKLLTQEFIPMDFLPNKFEFVRCITDKQNLITVYYTSTKTTDKVEASMLNEKKSWTPLKVIYENNDQSTSIVKIDMASSEHNAKHLLRVAYRKQGINYVKLIVFNQNLEIERSEDIELNNKDKKMLPEMAISDDGIPIVLFTDSESYKSQYQTLQIATLSSSSGAFDFTNVPIHEGGSISGLYLKVDNVHKQAWVLAWYAEGRNAISKSLYKGALDLTSLEVYPSVYVRFNSETKTIRSDLKDLNIRRVSVLKNGGCEVVAEREVFMTRTINNQPVMMVQGMPLGGLQNDVIRTVNEHYNDEIAIFNLEPNGKLAWSQLVFKEQFSTDDNGVFLSYATMETPKGKVYVYNDFSSKNDRVLVSYVAASGKLGVRELSLNENEVEGFTLLPRFGKQVAKHALIVPMISKSNLKFLKIDY